MPGVGSALGDDLHLGSGGAIEIGGLAGSIYLEFLDTILRGWDHARGAAIACSQVILRGHTTGWIASIAFGIDVHTAVHVIGVVAAVERLKQ